MAIKYIRDSGGPDRPARSYDPPSLFGSMSRAGLKQRLFLIYAGIGALLFALTLTNVRDRFDTFENQPELRGAAVVREKQDNGTLVLEIEGLSVLHAPNSQTLERFRTGDRVTVLYQWSRSGRQIRILEIGTVPLADPLSRPAARN